MSNPKTTPARTPGRPADEGREDLREALLDAAERLMAEQGFAATTVRGIAEAAGVNPALVHYYFGSKRDLLLAVMDRTFEPLAAALAEMRAAGAAHPADIVALVGRMAAEHPGMPRLMVREVMLSSGPLQRHFIEHYAPRLGGALPGLIAREQRAGRVDGRFDPAMLTLMLLSLALFPSVARDVARSVLGLDLEGAGGQRLAEQIGLLLEGGIAP